MNDIYTTIHPETGEPTKETEFVNSWKWKDDRSGFDHCNQQQRALVDRYNLPQDTPVEAINKMIAFQETYTKANEKYTQQLRINCDLMEALEAASYKEKDRARQEKEKKKNIKKFLNAIEKFLDHAPDCLVTTMKIVGRAKIKSKCNCGLSEVMKSVKI